MFRISSTNDLGAELKNTNIAELSENDFDILHRALLTHKVVVIRNHPPLEVSAFRNFAQRFGILKAHIESSAHHPEYDDINFVSNIVNQTTGAIMGIHGNHTETFHSDLSWSELPTKLTILQSIIRPDGCGHTLFEDTTAAYDSLPSDMKNRLRGLQGRYNYL